ANFAVAVFLLSALQELGKVLEKIFIYPPLPVRGKNRLELSNTVPELLDRVLSGVCDFVNADYGLVFLLQDSLFLLSADYNLAEKTKIRKRGYQLGEGLVGSAAQKGVLVSAVHPADNGMQVVAGAVKEWAFPIKAFDSVVGVIVLGRYKHFFSLEQKKLEFLDLLSGEIGLAINNLQLREELLKEKEQGTELFNAAAKIASVVKFDHVAERIIETVSQLTGATATSLMLYDQEEQLLKIRFAKGLPAKVVKELKLAKGEGIAGKVFAEGRPLFVPDVEQSPDYKFIISEKRLHSLFSVPLLSEKKILGVLNMGTESPLPEEKKTLVEALAYLAAVAIENALNYQSMEELATHDGLTGLYNYRFFQKKLAEEVERSKRYRHPLSLALLDIDDFKFFNDTYGHIVGDRLLKEISQVISRNLRQSDTLARYGGDEMAVILPETNSKEAYLLMNRIQGIVARLDFASTDRQITFSAGICSFSNIEDAEELLKRTDQALLKAKGLGKNQVYIYDSP
ncbi:MAG: diguanylate cyclase, partial [Firmicutes bacterium]|nr:diguanylate cyclase [Bacillota bacterium]